jgi:hypothetical protein
VVVSDRSAPTLLGAHLASNAPASGNGKVT